MSRRLRKFIVKLRMWWADIRGHHGKVWDYEPGDYYMGMGRKKGYREHEEAHEKNKKRQRQVN